MNKVRFYETGLEDEDIYVDDAMAFTIVWLSQDLDRQDDEDEGESYIQYIPLYPFALYPYYPYSDVYSGFYFYQNYPSQNWLVNGNYY